MLLSLVIPVWPENPTVGEAPVSPGIVDVLCQSLGQCD
jgi:hypothetical protein